MMTSLPSISLSLSLSLSLSHRKYLTHNIGSASALPIMLPHENIRARILTGPEAVDLIVNEVFGFWLG